MNTFLRSIGFGKLKKQKDIEGLVLRVVQEAANKSIYTRKDGTVYAEYSLPTSSSCGIKVCGEEDIEGKLHFNHSFPYICGSAYSNEDDIYINKKIDTDALTGMCDDYRIGISLIFYIQNVAECYNSFGEAREINEQNVKFAALAESGKILLPTFNYAQEQLKRKREANRKNKLIAEAKKGNLEAIESLTMNDIDNYARVSMRIKNEDLLSIVDTSISPYGSESETYNITGNILEVSSEINMQTGEKIWILKLECNEIAIDVCINETDLFGEPAVGRRFRGNVWLQGSVVKGNT